VLVDIVMFEPELQTEIRVRIRQRSNADGRPRRHRLHTERAVWCCWTSS